jgi:hypothetical protein
MMKKWNSTLMRTRNGKMGLPNGWKSSGDRGGNLFHNSIMLEILPSPMPQIRIWQMKIIGKFIFLTENNTRLLTLTNISAFS